ncbi:LacI family DNA-binding transcriptional regulator [Paenibacillus sp. 1P07SE]|uniref:LacI family DNA-binding transcriptional regulator n=1 Tax=Paenibacillus sp. 1P07SE TaxID=3132209 RepID=UPI0039A46EF5
MGTRKAVTLRDLSSELGLSIQTISKALGGRPGMSEETRSRVLRTAFRRGYLTVAQAREMASRGIAPYPTFQLRFVLVQSRQSSNYNIQLAEGLTARLDQLDHRLERYTLDKDLSDRDFSAWLEAGSVAEADGLLIAPRLITDSMERKLLSLPVPKVLINYPRPLSQVDSVIWDVFEGVCMAVDKLVQLGHKRILYVGDVDSQRGYLRRWQAFQEMMAEHGLAADAGLLVPGGWTASELRDQLAACRATAIVAGLDEDVERLLGTLAGLGCRVPEDISVIGLANRAPVAYPELSRPVLPIRETGYKAADKLLWRLANPSEPIEHIRIAGRFYDGQTIAPLA